MILALDTLTPQTQIAIGSVCKSFPPSKDQAEMLMGQIEECMAGASASWGQVSSVVVLTGPGSFTGLRVGLSVAHGIGIARDIPVFGISVVKAFEKLLPLNKPHWLLIDSRRKDLALAYRPEGTEFFTELEEKSVENTMRIILERAGNLSGNGISMLPESFTADKVIHSEWIDLAALVNAMHDTVTGNNKSGYHAIECEPVYLRAPDVTLSAQKFEHQSLYAAQ